MYIVIMFCLNSFMSNSGLVSRISYHLVKGVNDRYEGRWINKGIFFLKKKVIQ